jgi:putative oxidoreductase
VKILFRKTLAPYTDHAYALLRVFSGLLFSFHGMQKVFGILTSQQPPIGSQIWCGGVIELVGGIAIAAGLFTSCAAFVASGTMAVAYVQFHWKFAFDKSFFPAVNKGELAVVYAFLFLYIACCGAGRFSLDARRSARS